MKIKFLDIYWVLSNLFCLSHFKSILIPHLNPIEETIENNVSLFRNLLSLLCWIIGFRHYFGDPYPFFFQNGSNIPLCFFFFFLWKDYTNDDSLVIKDRKSFLNSASDKFYFFYFKLVRILIFRFLWFIYGKSIYKVVPTYWLILTLDSSSWLKKAINTFCSSFIMYYLQPEIN